MGLVLFLFFYFLRFHSLPCLVRYSACVLKMFRYISTTLTYSLNSAVSAVLLRMNAYSNLHFKLLRKRRGIPVLYAEYFIGETLIYSFLNRTKLSVMVWICFFYSGSLKCTFHTTWSKRNLCASLNLQYTCYACSLSRLSLCWLFLFFLLCPPLSQGLR